MIHEHLELYPDKIIFRCVCADWQFVSPARLPDLRQQQPPWLLLPYESGSLCGLYDPFEKKVYEIDLPEAGEKAFKGSGYGWIVTVQRNGSIDVLNPLSRVRIALPPRHTFPDVLEYRPDEPGKEYLMKGSDGEDPYALDATNVRDYQTDKISLSCSPTCGDFVAVATCRGILAYCKVGDEKWIAYDDTIYSPRGCKDIAFLGGKLYATTCAGLARPFVQGVNPVTDPGYLMICDDIAAPCPELRICAPLPYFYTDNDHMINSSHGGLMLVQRFMYHLEEGGGGLGTDNKAILNVFKFDWSSSSWIQMESLDDEIFFMGVGTQFGISSQRNNRNQIYSANNPSMLDFRGNGIISFDDLSRKPLGYECNNVPKLRPSPIWITPNPY